jgi:hypothetical protein
MNTVANAITYFDEKVKNKPKINNKSPKIFYGKHSINRQSPQKEMIDSESERLIPYLDIPGSSSKYVGGNYEGDKEHNSTARFKYDQNRRLEKKEKERIKTENSNVTNFPNSDTFFNHINTHTNIVEEEESVKAMAPMTYTNISSEDMIEDSMNVEMMEPKDQVYEDYNKLKYEFFRLKRENEQLKNNYKQVGFSQECG